MDINNKLILENTVKKNNINLKKLDSSIKSYDYFTRNFFLNNTIVPSVHVGTDSRDSREENLVEQKQQFGISTRVAHRN